MVGGTSHMESFDPKPELTKHAGKTMDESPHKEAVFGSKYLKNVREQAAALHGAALARPLPDRLVVLH